MVREDPHHGPGGFEDFGQRAGPPRLLAPPLPGGPTGRGSGVSSADDGRSAGSPDAITDSEELLRRRKARARVSRTSRQKSVLSNLLPNRVYA
jgi:hypothetical protein